MTSPLMRALFALLLSMVIIGMTMSAATQRGMGQTAALGTPEQRAIAISMSQLVYDINLHYLGLKQVYDKLTTASASADPVNAGIQAASSLEAPTPGYVSDGTLIPAHNDEKGQVDYVTIAFQLFGLSVQSLLYLFFALLALSTVLFIFTFRDNVYALAVLLCTLAAYYMAPPIAGVDQHAATTYAGAAYGSSVCLVAMWHFVFLVVLQRKPALWVVLASIVQLAILILAWRMNGTKVWLLGFLIVLALAPALRHLRLRQFSRLRSLRSSTVEAAKSLYPVVQEALRWPIVLLLSGLFVSSLYDQARLHPVYFTDDLMPYRSMWNDAYLGLARYDPRVLGGRVEDAAKQRGVGEELLWWAARDRMNDIRMTYWDGRLVFDPPAAGLTGEWSGIGVREGMQDRMVRGAFAHALNMHRGRSFKIYLVRKPADIASSLIHSLAGSMTWAWLSVFVGLVVGGFVMKSSQGTEEVRVPRRIMQLSGAAVLAGAMPSLWAYPSPLTMRDLQLLFVAFLPICVAMAIAMIWMRSRR